VGKLNGYNLQPWLRERRYLWIVAGALALVATPLVWAWVTLRDEMAELKMAMRECCQLMLMRVDLGEEDSGE